MWSVCDGIKSEAVGRIPHHLPRGVYTIEILEQMLHSRNRGEDFSVCLPPLTRGKEEREGKRRKRAFAPMTGGNRRPCTCLNRAVDGP